VNKIDITMFGRLSIPFFYFAAWASHDGFVTID